MPSRRTASDAGRDQRIVFTEGYVTTGFASDPAQVISTFTERDGRTTLTVTILHTSTENRDGHLDSGMKNGAGATYDRLASLVEGMV